MPANFERDYLMQKIGLDLGRHHGPKTTFQNPELVKLSQCTKKMTIIFLRVINISEKNPRKPVY